MTDVFFSYSSRDRERVRPIRDALVAEGFDVFWDQEVPAGRDWDEWIRQHLDGARCAIVFWSEHSIKSDNVRHEATVAKNMGKLIPVLLDHIEANQFPMGHYTTQGIHWSASGNPAASLLRLREEVESKAMRRWMRRKLVEAEARTGATSVTREQLADLETALTKRMAESENSILRRLLEIEKAVHAVQQRSGGAQTETRQSFGRIGPAEAKGQEIIFLSLTAKKILSGLAMVGLSVAVLVCLFLTCIAIGRPNVPAADWWPVAAPGLIICSYLWYMVLMRIKYRKY